MNRILTLILSLMILLPCTGRELTLTTSGSHSPLTVEPQTQSGLEAVYVVYGTDGLTATYRPDTPGAEVRWMRYSTLGGGYAEPVNWAVSQNGISVLAGLEGDMGYIVEEGGRQYAFYVVDWLKHPCELKSVSLPQSGRECGNATLTTEGRAERMSYVGINGRSIEIDRDITVSYNTLEWNEAGMNFVQTGVEKSFSHLSSELTVDAPYCGTAFVLTGDRFAAEWGITEEVRTPYIEPWSVTAHTSAVRRNDSAPNQKPDTGADESGLGGSAPAEVEFTAEVTDAAIFTEWQFAQDAEFNIITLRFNEPEIVYTFDRAGTTYVRFVCASADGSCEYYSDSYAINISESMLECPNAFSPGVSEGTNDEWRVSYRSIVRFECHIFDRSGHKIITLHDPSQGWDGRRGGKLVPAGVYYYVIRAEGSDGRKYKLSGDINIVGYR